jgi:hypothetical protein
LRRASLLGAAAAVGALLMLLWQWSPIADFVTYKRDARTSSPGLSALFSREVVLLKAKQSACLKPVTFYADTGQARIRLRAPRRPTPRIDLQMRAPGYSETVRLGPLDPRVEGLGVVEFPEPRREVTGEFCFRNRGPTAIQLIGTNEGRSLTPVELRVDGVLKKDASLELALLRAGRHSLGSRRGELIDRAATFTSGWTPEWLLWPIALLFGGLPLVVAALFGVSVWRAERRR